MSKAVLVHNLLHHFIGLSKLGMVHVILSWCWMQANRVPPPLTQSSIYPLWPTWAKHQTAELKNKLLNPPVHYCFSGAERGWNVRNFNLVFWIKGSFFMLGNCRLNTHIHIHPTAHAHSLHPTFIMALTNFFKGCAQAGTYVGSSQFAVHWKVKRKQHKWAEF